MVTFNIISDAAPVTDKDQQIGEPNKVTDNLEKGDNKAAAEEFTQLSPAEQDRVFASLPSDQKIALASERASRGEFKLVDRLDDSFTDPGEKMQFQSLVLDKMINNGDVDKAKEFYDYLINDPGGPDKDPAFTGAMLLEFMSPENAQILLNSVEDIDFANEIWKYIGDIDSQHLTLKPVGFSSSDQTQDSLNKPNS